MSSKGIKGCIGLSLGRGSVVLDLNPHPLKPEGAAPKSRNGFAPMHRSQRRAGETPFVPQGKPALPRGAARSFAALW
jgi:hypothetical protein